MAAPEYDFEKLAREIVASRLAEIKAAPAAAAEIVRKILVAAIVSTKVRQDPVATTRAVCRGAAGGLFVIGKDLPAAAVKILKEIGAVASETHQDPTALMSAAMEGLADVAAAAGPEACSAIQSEIDEEFMGAGGVFRSFCDAAMGRRPR